MKPSIYITALFSSLLLITSGCSNNSKSNHAGNAQEQQLDDSQIVQIMMTVDKGEIAASEEAEKKNSNLAVDQYAQYIIQQHERNLEILNALSKQLGLTPKESTISRSLVTGGEHDLKTLSALEDRAFDKTYIDSMVKGHQDGLNLIDTKLLPQTKNPQLKVFVEQFRAMVADHLQKALEVQRSF